MRSVQPGNIVACEVCLCSETLGSLTAEVEIAYQETVPSESIHLPGTFLVHVLLAPVFFATRLPSHDSLPVSVCYCQHSIYQLRVDCTTMYV